jgi:DNA/RNA-binding domain of Phe-tRNA-synthetase-like protein
VSDGEPAQGWIADEVAAEFGELRLWYTEITAPAPKTTPALKARLRDLSSRFNGGQAVALRTKPIPNAYRVFFRHIGLDPDVERVPVEQLVVRRLTQGGFLPTTLLEDAVTIAVMETSVGIWALDAGTVAPPFGVRAAVEHEPLGRRDERAPWLPSGRLCVADAEGPVAVLFGDVAPGHQVTRETTSAYLFAVQVAGVPAIHVSEALWTVEDIVAGADQIGS